MRTSHGARCSDVNFVIGRMELINNVDNLEWCTQHYNLNYGNRRKKISEALKGRKKVGLNDSAGSN